MFLLLQKRAQPHLKCQRKNSVVAGCGDLSKHGSAEIRLPTLPECCAGAISRSLFLPVEFYVRCEKQIRCLHLWAVTSRNVSERHEHRHRAREQFCKC